MVFSGTETLFRTIEAHGQGNALSLIEVVTVAHDLNLIKSHWPPARCNFSSFIIYSNNFTSQYSIPNSFLFRFDINNFGL
jgi:hypothetical protein